MKTAMVFRADGRLQAIFKIDDMEKFKILLKAVYDFPYYIELIDDVPTLSSIMNVEQNDDDITISMKDRYNTIVEISVKDNVVVNDGTIVCTEEKFKQIFSK
jgi:hypothetical protein